MERSRANKKKFQMRSPFKGSIAEFMAMGKTLGSSKISPSTAVDPSKYYKAPGKAPSESAVDKMKRTKAEKYNTKQQNKSNKKQAAIDANKKIGQDIAKAANITFEKLNTDPKYGVQKDGI